MTFRAVRRFVSAVVVASALACVNGAVSAQPFDFDTAFGRLPKNVVPTDYTIAIVPNTSARTLTGRERIALDVRSTAATIVFNTLNESLANVRLDGRPVAKVVTDNGKQLTTVTPIRPVPVGKHVLTFAYTGAIETAPQGLFAQPYRNEDGTDGVMLSTQFEATDARRMFPCWDEPAFRATYALSVTVPAIWTTVSNMPPAHRVQHGTLATTTFERSPKMPSYLVEFSAGRLASIVAARDGTQFGVVAVRGRENDGRVALANAQTILADYNDYFGYRYPLPKLDSIAVPGGFQGAMENWGAITYNDQALLLNASSTLRNRQTVFSIQAHEMAHQWNGDLVTMGWWDDLWLNESFASWRAAKETDMRNPTWNWWENEDASKEGAMDADAHLTSHPIKVHIADELQAENAFDPEITYAKGQAFLRMLEAYLGDDTFRDGIRRYMKARAFSNATGTDLWNALSAASGQDVAALSRTWTEQPGFPLVAVSASCDSAGHRTIALRQSRFLYRGSTPAARWIVPLDIRDTATGPARRALLTTGGQTVPAGVCTDPLAVNAGAIGFYRVAYDDATLAVNARAFGSLLNGDRIALLDDQWALVKAGKAKLPSYLALASSMGNDLDARAWNQITDALESIEHDERGTAGYANFLAYARSIVKPVATQLGWDAKSGETPDLQGLRRTVLRELGVWGDRDVIARARATFATFVTDRNAIAPDDQTFILQIVAANADAATFEQMHMIAKSAKNETEVRRYYSALADVRDPDLATKAMQIALSSEIPPQAATMRFEIIGAAANYNPQLSWRFVKKHYTSLVKPFGSSAAGFIAQFIPPIYWRGAPLPEIKAFIMANVPAEIAPFVAKGMERAQFDADQKAAIVPAADTYVGAQNMRNGSTAK